MKIEVDEEHDLILKEVFSGVGMETEEGNKIGVCMRDDTFEINVMPNGKNTRNWWRVNMQTGQIESQTVESPSEDSHTPEAGKWVCDICGEIDNAEIKYMGANEPYHIFRTGSFVAPTHAVKWIPDEPKQQEPKAQEELTPFEEGLVNRVRELEAWNRRADEPKAQEVSSLDEMEQYVGMPCLFWGDDDNEGDVNDKCFGILGDPRYYSITDGYSFNDETHGRTWQYCEPHPQSVELLALRKENAERVKAHNEIFDEPQKAEADNAELKQRIAELEAEREPKAQEDTSMENIPETTDIIDRLEAEVKKWKLISFAPIGDNHHSAVACPHCNPEYQNIKDLQEQVRVAVGFIKQATFIPELRDEAQATLTQINGEGDKR